MSAPVLTQWSFLDPARMQADINAAHHGAITNDALLSPALFEHQVNAIVPSPVRDLFAHGKRPITDCTYWNPVNLESQIS